MPNRIDTFNRADTADAIGTPSDGGADWFQGAGVWGINGNQGYESGGVGQNNLLWLESSLSDVDVQVTVNGTTAVGVGILARVFNDGNYLMFQYAEGVGLRLFKCDAGVFTQLGSTVPHTLAAGQVFKLSCNGTSVTAYVDGVSKIAVTESFMQTSTMHGLTSYGSIGTRFEDFSVAAAGGGGGGGGNGAAMHHHIRNMQS